MAVKWFITRVELHGVDENEWLPIYKILHEEMGKEKFHVTVTAGSGKVLHLPHAMYFSKGDIEATDVRELAILAVTNTKTRAQIAGYNTSFKARILAMETPAWASSNLRDGTGS